MTTILIAKLSNGVTCSGTFRAIHTKARTAHSNIDAIAPIKSDKGIEIFVKARMKSLTPNKW